MNKKLIAAVALVFAMVAVAAAAYAGLIPAPGRLSTPEDSARYYPGDAVAYASFTIHPPEEQRLHALDVWERLNRLPEFEDLVDGFEEYLWEDAGVDLREDALPWMGPEVSLAVLDYDAAMTVDVRDGDAAAEFIAGLLERDDDSQTVVHQPGSYRAFDTWLSGDESWSLALGGDLLVIATAEAALHDVMDAISGDASGNSLAENPDFQEARGVLPEDRFASVYVDLSRALDTAGNDLLPLDSMTGACGGDVLDDPSWLMASAGWVENGVVIEMTTPTSGGPWPGATATMDPAAALPSGVTAFAAMTFDPNVDRWREALSQCPIAGIIPGDLPDDLMEGLNAMVPFTGTGGAPFLDENATLADALDAGLLMAALLVGVDLEAGFLDHLGGELVVAARELNVESLLSGGEKPIELMALLSHNPGAEAAIQSTLDRVMESLLPLGVERVNLGGAGDALVLKGELLESTGYSPGLVLHDGYLTLATTEGLLETIVGLRDGGPSDTLASSARYRQAAAHLPEDPQYMAYVDLHAIARSLGLDKGLPGVEIIGAVAASGSIGPEYAKSALVVTLNPEK